MERCNPGSGHVQWRGEPPGQMRCNPAVIIDFIILYPEFLGPYRYSGARLDWWIYLRKYLLVINIFLKAFVWESIAIVF